VIPVSVVIWGTGFVQTLSINYSQSAQVDKKQKPVTGKTIAWPVLQVKNKLEGGSK